MKLFDTMKQLVRKSTIAMAVTVAMTSTTMIATHDAYAFPHLSFGRIAELTDYQRLHRIGMALSIVPLPAAIVLGGVLLGIDFPAAALFVGAVGIAATGIGLYNLWKAHHDVGTITGNDRWFLDLTQRQRQQFFPDYYHPGSSVSRNANTRGGSSGALAPASGGAANMGMHH